ncbi:MAG: response regulator [Bacillota bacterium]|jgi:two-component system response regulator (stage 0 sporulation protein F)
MDFSKYSILVVDDQTGVRRLLQETFREEGYNVDTAKEGAEALVKIKESPPSLVLLDMKMPGMNGLETLHQIIKDNPAQVVIMMTAYEELEVVQEARKLGVKDYITKPFDLNYLKELIKSILCKTPKG